MTHVEFKRYTKGCTVRNKIHHLGIKKYEAVDIYMTTSFIIVIMSRTRWARNKRDKKWKQDFQKSLIGRCHIRRPRCGWNDNIKRDLTEIRHNDVN
jgi:hypothetical protein